MAFRFEIDDHDDEGDGSSSGDDYHDDGDNSQIRLPNSVYANAGVHIRPQRAKVTNPIPLDTWPQRHPHYIQSQLFDWIVCALEEKPQLKCSLCQRKSFFSLDSWFLQMARF